MEDPTSAPQTLAGRARRWIDRILHGTHHHYRNVMPDDPGPALARALALFYSGVRLEELQVAALRQLPADAIVVYASKFKSDFAFLFAYHRYRRLGVRFPRIGLGGRFFIWQPPSRMLRILLAHADSLLRHGRWPDPYDSGFLHDELLKAEAGFFTLIQKTHFWQRFGKGPVDPVEFLIRLQKTTAQPVLVVPQIMFFGKRPRRASPTLIDMLFGPEDEPGRLRRLALMFKQSGNAFVEISPPISVQRFLERPDIAPHDAEYQAAILRGEILAQINRHRQSITGPVIKSRAELRESILSGERFQQTLESHAQTHGMAFAEVRMKAAGYLDEIAAAYSLSWILVYSHIVAWLLRTLFDGLSMNPANLAAIKRMSLRGPLVFIPSHKSHFDYLLISYVLYHNDLPCPLVAAGKNLSFWPMGPLFRRGGAFFIRRTFRGAVLYSRTFAEYIHKILEEGYNVEQFIEGGRSRTGKLLLPKLGLLSILLNAYKNGACPDMVFVPVSIGYDRVLEEKSYLQEIEGGTKQAENFWQVVRARKFLRKRYGKVYLQFGEPISLQDQAARDGQACAEMTPKELSRFCRNLAHRIAYDIDRVSVATPHALAAAAILNAARDRFSFEELMSVVEVYLNHLFAVETRIADTLILDHRRAIAHALDSYVQRKALEALKLDPQDPAESAGFVLSEGKRPLLDYYKNSCIAFFIPAAFTALAILQKDAFQFSAADLHTDYELLQNLFRFEFVFDSDTPTPLLMRRALKTFVDDAVLIPHPSLPDTYNVTAAGYRKLKLFAMFLKTLLESYGIVAHYLMQTPNDTGEPKDRIKKIVALGRRMHRHKEFDHIEAISKIAFENALEYFTAAGIRGSGDRDLIAPPATAIQRALKHLQQ
jgi:glycerol-3-phosphate O-acyltransferase